MGEASDDDIKSFVAGINLGMRRHFAGKVDHIRTTVVEAQLDGLAIIRSLFGQVTENWRERRDSNPRPSA